MKFPTYIFVVFLTLICVAFVSPSFALEESKTTISEIKIIGNQRIELSTIVEFIGVKKGDVVDASKTDEILSKVFDTGLFADVVVTLDGDVLIVRVVENPIISKVIFEGNKKINKITLEKEVKLATRSVYTKTDLQHDVKRIHNLYRKSGRFSAKVVPKVVQLAKNRVNLIYEIDEGDRSKIAKISFVGNNRFSDSKLSHVIQTKETRWYRFFSSDDTYDADRLAFDQEKLRRFYVSHGFADFRVLSANAELSPKKEVFFITFTVEEGKVYKFGEMSAKSELEDVESDKLYSSIKTIAGEVFNAKLVEDTIEEITKYLGDLGYAFVKIEPQYSKNKEDATLGINYVIREGPRVYIENINIAGNVRTLDEVIRREFRIADGDPYNAAKLRRSQQRIRNLGFFESVEVKNLRGSAPDKVNIDVNVQEASTGELSFGAGFSTTEGALGNVGISEKNLLGKGQYLKLNFTLASVRKEVDLSFTEPYFMGREIAAGFDIFKLKTDSTSSSTRRTYNNDAIGVVLRTSYPVTEHMKHSMKYSFRSDDITDIDSFASEFIRRQEGKNTTSLIGHTLLLDMRDSRFEPTEGYYIKFNQDIAGLGGDSKFFRNEIRAAYYMPVLKDDWILKLAGKSGYIFGFGGEDVRINNRFFVGGNNLRGFNSEGVGPRDKASTDPLGGNFYATSTAEVTFPLGTSEELGFKGSIFTDIGTLFDTDDTSTATSTVLDRASIRASIGVGVGWGSPIGPIRIDIAYPIAKESFDETEQIHFSFGTRF